MKNVLKIALLNTLFFGFLQASSALAVEQKAYLETEAGETEIQFPAEAESVVLGLYYHPTPEEGTTGVGVVVNFDHTVSMTQAFCKSLLTATDVNCWSYG